jgi:hypothetical protein
MKRTATKPVEPAGIDNFPPQTRPKTHVYCSMAFGDITISVIDVTRELALHWVKRHNTHNRNLRPMRQASYARDMVAGEWPFNGDSIRISVEGIIIDGQHRLESVIEAGVTLPFLIVEGLPLSVQDTIDLNAVRTLADQLKLAGYANPTMLAAVARRLVIVKTGLRGGPGPGGGRFSPTKREMRQFIDHPDNKVRIGRAVEVSLRAHAVGLPAAPSVIGAAYFLAAEKDPLAAEIFFYTKLIESTGLEPEEPARTLQIRLQREANSPSGQMDPELVFRYAILAWNHWREGKNSLDRLQKPRNGWPSYNMLVVK